jgi:hypothetical protein
MAIKNQSFSLNVNENGIVDSLVLLNDSKKMNWVIDKAYLEEANYYSSDKLMGNFEFKVEDKMYSSATIAPKVRCDNNKCIVDYDYEQYQVSLIFDLSEDNEITWSIHFENRMTIPIKLQHFGLWASFSYIMFRDTDVLRNIFHSAALFPSISKDFTKLAVMRRTGRESSLGIYQTKGTTNSIGSYCDFTNGFLENSSPSLDGIIFHQLILSGEHSNENDWIYSDEQILIEAGETHSWIYKISQVSDMNDFYLKSKEHGHPIVKNPGMAIVGQPIAINITEGKVCKAEVWWQEQGSLRNASLTLESQTRVTGSFAIPGEYKIIITFADDKEDLLVINVVKDIKEMIDNRVDYLCNISYQENDKTNPHAFRPVHNQGESVGKMSLVLKKNLLDDNPDKSQIYKVEKSVNEYLLNSWFENGDFLKPRKLYGDFYRVMDFEYIGHVIYLLSLLPDEVLTLQNSNTYLLWAARVVELRINPDLHVSKRAKEEAKMLGVFFLYIDDLLKSLVDKQIKGYEHLEKLWMDNLKRIVDSKDELTAAMTEHYYDNAGFGPAAAALANAGYRQECLWYGDLVLANIGFSNDFRAQNPDRWWEALSYMIHSLWGGITAAATLDVFHLIKDPRYLEASYRAFMGILYCYDTNSTATVSLNPGEAVSTYAVPSPHYNRPDLSKMRFGQEVFAKDGGIFAMLFPKEDTQTSDWDMGEELVAYLDRFGQDAYCYFDGQGILRGVNCHLEVNDSEVRITSYAPYPKRIYLLDKTELKVLPGNGREAILEISCPNLKVEFCILSRVVCRASV